MKHKQPYILPLITVSVQQQSRLRLLHERMIGATAYIIRHPLSSYKCMARSAVDDFFDTVEALIPQEEVSRG